jgi:hypothetical protein
MKYEAPELTALTPAINAIQSTTKGSGDVDNIQLQTQDASSAAYEDWE